jgi:hypothetical protein
MIKNNKSFIEFKNLMMKDFRRNENREKRVQTMRNEIENKRTAFQKIAFFFRARKIPDTI